LQHSWPAKIAFLSCSVSGSRVIRCLRYTFHYANARQVDEL
jgi:hypothetical protein